MKLPNWFGIFKKLQWKLTLSYTVITVVVLLILEYILLFVVGSKLIYDNPIFSTTQVAYLRHFSSQIGYALEDEQIDRSALMSWIGSVEKGVWNFDGKQGYLIARFLADSSVMAVTDPKGIVLAANSQNLSWLDKSLFIKVSPEVKQIVLRASGGEETATQLHQPIETGTVAIAMPIFDPTKKTVLGMVYFQYKLPSFFEIVPIIAETLFPQIIFLTIFTGMIGILFGFLVARGLTRRLNALTQMTSGWGKGDFSRACRDTSGDEIGELASDLNRTALELQQLVRTRQDIAIFEERNRLARDLHDNVKQQVFAITMNLGAARSLWKKRPDEAFTKVEATGDLARQVQTDLNGLINALRPVQLEDKPLIEALKEYILAWEKRSGIAVIYQVEGSVVKLPAEIELALYLVTQEAFSNIARHSHASAASLIIHFDTAVIRFTLSDNGRGFDPKVTASGIGLFSMEERIQAVGGHFKIGSLPNEGVKIEFDVPLSALEAE